MDLQFILPCPLSYIEWCTCHKNVFELQHIREQIFKRIIHLDIQFNLLKYVYINIKKINVFINFLN